MDKKLLEKLKPENVLFFRYCRDMNYDHKSEDMGYFYDVIYEKGDELVMESANVGEFELIEEFLKRADGVLVKKDELNTNEMKLYNKDTMDEVKWKNGVVKYKGEEFKID